VTSRLQQQRDAWRAANRQRELDKNAEWREKNRDKHRALIAAWKLKNGPRLMESVRFRQARKRNATPPWLTKEQREQIVALYDLAAMLNAAGFPTHVDHIVPLRGKLVCGLHVPWNLQLLSAGENMAKGAKL
jgi:hypothetical protein